MRRIRLENSCMCLRSVRPSLIDFRIGVGGEALIKLPYCEGGGRSTACTI